MPNPSAKPWKILIAHYRPDIVSGAENSIADFLDQSDERFDYTMLVPGDGKLAQFFRKRGFKVWVKKVETPRRLFPGLHAAQSAILARQIKAKGFDAVICNTMPAASRVSTAAGMTGLPLAIYMRDYIPNDLARKRILARADAVFCISKDVKDHLNGMVAQGKTLLTYNYIHPDPILDRAEAHSASGERLLPFPSTHPIIGLVGRITPYKQPDVFLRAASLVLQHRPEARFVLVGAAQEREKPYEESLKELVRSLGIDQQVVFMGERKDAVEITSEFSIACLASGREPLGRVILEANLLNVPVVVPDSGGPAEIVEDGVTGLRFSATGQDASEQMAKQIVRLLDDKELRDCLVHKAHNHVMTSFASSRHVRIQEEYIEKLCNHEL